MCVCVCVCMRVCVRVARWVDEWVGCACGWVLITAIAYTVQLGLHNQYLEEVN